MIDASMLLVFVVGFFVWVVALWVIMGLAASAHGDLVGYFRRMYPEEYSRLQPPLSFGEMIFGSRSSGMDQWQQFMILFSEEVQLNEKMISLQRKLRRWSLFILGYFFATVMLVVALVYLSTIDIPEEMIIRDLHKKFHHNEHVDYEVAGAEGCSGDYIVTDIKILNWSERAD